MKKITTWVKAFIVLILNSIRRRKAGIKRETSKKPMAIAKAFNKLGKPVLSIIESYNGVKNNFHVVFKDRTEGVYRLYPRTNRLVQLF